MAIKETHVDVVVGYRGTAHYESLGYKIPRKINNQGRLTIKRGEKIKVKVSDLPKSSNVVVTKVCDKCGEEVPGQTYNQVIKTRKSGVDRCKSCSYEAMKETKLTSTKKEKSFAFINPDLVGMWHDSNSLRADQVPAYTDRKFKFICENDPNHVYQAQVRHVSNGHRCPICNMSRGEKRIKSLLDRFNVKYEQQVTKPGLVGVNGGDLSFDFEVGGILIEFDGIQHFKPVDFLGKGDKFAKEAFEIQTENDSRKNAYCAERGIKLIRIPYYMYDQIESVLLTELKELREETPFAASF